MPRFVAMSLTLLAFFLYAGWKRRSLVFPGVAILLALAAFFALNLLSTAWALNGADAVYESQKIFLAMASIVYFLSLLRTDADEHLVVKSVVLVTALYVAFALYELAQLPNLHTESLYRVKSFSEHRNLLGSFLFLLMSFTVYGAWLFGGKWKIFSGLLFFLVFGLILVLQVRSVYLAVMVAALSFALGGFRKILQYKRLVGLLLLLVTGLVLALGYFNSDLLARLNLASYQSSITGMERLNIWGKTLQLIADHPLSGVGAGNWQYNFTRYAVGDINMVKWYGISFQRPHNDFLWIISETGLAGFTLILFTVFYCGVRCIAALRQGIHPRVLIFQSFLLGLMTDAFFSFDKERITHIVLAALMFAILLRQLKHTLIWPDRSGRPLALVLSLFLIFNLVIGFYRIRGEYFTRLLLSYKAANRPRETIDYGHRAVSAFYLSDPTSTPVYTYIGWGYNALQKPDSMAFVSEQAYRIAPYDHEVLSNYGFVLERLGRRDEARRVLTRALRIHPYFEATIFNLVVLEYNSRNFREAYRLLCTIPGYQEKHAPHVERIRMKAMQQAGS